MKKIFHIHPIQFLQLEKCNHATFSNSQIYLKSDKNMIMLHTILIKMLYLTSYLYTYIYIYIYMYIYVYIYI